MTDAASTPPLADAGWQGVSPRLWRARLLVLATTVTAASAVLVVIANVNAGGAAAGWTAVGCLAVGLWLAWLVWRRCRAWGYAERAEDLLIRRGVMVRKLSVVPYGRMQFVDVTAGPIDRLFGLATVQLHTAAAATDAQIPGLDRADAARLRDHLAALGEAKATGL